MLKGFSNPIANIEQIGISSGMRVADFGAGSGHYSLAAAEKVGDSGKVFAVDIQRDLLARFKNEIHKNNLDNIEIIWADLEKVGGSKLAPYSIDVVLVANILFQLEDKDSFIKEVARVIKPGGKVLLVDWTDSYGGLGPTSDMVMTKSEALSLFQKEGFQEVREIEAGEHHYGLILKKG